MLQLHQGVIRQFCWGHASKDVSKGSASMPQRPVLAVSPPAPPRSRRQVWTLVPWDPTAVFILARKHQQVYQELQVRRWSERSLAG